MTHSFLIAGNWKMNPETFAEAKNIVTKIKKQSALLKKTEVVACPPLLYLSGLVSSKKTKNFSLGAQTVSIEINKGPHTGEISSIMLKNLGMEYVIVGHSEQRQKGETDEVIAKKIKNVLEGGLIPIVCVGEKERDIDGKYLEGLKQQIRATLSDIAPKYAKNIVLAYEPIWAIGGVEPMKPEEIYEMSIFVKKVFADIFTPEVGIKTTVLYGGSVNAENAAQIMLVGKVDGLLVGRESVNPPGFVELLKAVDGVA